MALPPHACVLELRSRVGSVLVLVLALALAGEALDAHSPLHDLPPHLGAVVRGGLRLRGGSPDDRTLVESRRLKKGLTAMDTTNKIRASKGKRVGETLVEAAAAIVPGITELMPNTLTELRQKKKRRQLTAEEADVANVLAHQQHKDVGRPRARKGRGALDGTTVASELCAVERELGALRQSMEDAPDPDATEKQHSRALGKLERKQELLLDVQRDLHLASRYAAVKDEERDEEGALMYQISNHSMWLDALDDARLDDVDQWHLGLHDGPTSRYTSAWDKKNMGDTLSLESKRRVLRGPYPPRDSLMGSARALKPLPSSGVHYFEVIMRIDGGTWGSSLGGGNYIGLVDGNVTNWDACWELNTASEDERTKPEIEWGSTTSESLDEEGDMLLPWTISKSAKGQDGKGGVVAAQKKRKEQRSRRNHIMALHDSCCRPRGEVTWATGLRVPWVNGSAFGHGECVGLLVNMDTRTVNVYKNRKFLGKAFGKLPDQVYPFVCLSQPEISAELCFPKFEEEVRRETLQSALWKSHQDMQTPPPPPLVSVKRMAQDPVTHRSPLSKKLRLKMKELKGEIRLRGTEKGPPETESVPGHSLWNFNTIDYWIDLHKCRYALFLLGERPPAESRFVNGNGERLVMRGDGDQPPLTQEEDRQRGSAKGHQVELQKLLMSNKLMKTAMDGNTALGPANVRLLDCTKQPMQVRPEFLIEAGGKREHGQGGGMGGTDSPKDEEGGKSGKTYLPWSAYRKEQKKGRRDTRERPGTHDEAYEDHKRIEQRRKMGHPDEDAVMPVWDMRRDTLEEMELPKAIANNNPRRALKDTLHARKESVRRLRPPPRFGP